MDCLTHHGQARSMYGGEDLEILRYIKSKGKEAVLLAIIGAKYEKSTDKFNPSDWLHLGRIFGEKQFNKFVNQGARCKNISDKRKKKDELRKQVLG